MFHFPWDMLALLLFFDFKWVENYGNYTRVQKEGKADLKRAVFWQVAGCSALVAVVLIRLILVWYTRQNAVHNTDGIKLALVVPLLGGLAALMIGKRREKAVRQANGSTVKSD